MLQYIDSFENDKVIYVATEYVEPLGYYLADKIPGDGRRDLYLAWAIFQITVSLRAVIAIILVSFLEVRFLV